MKTSAVVVFLAVIAVAKADFLNEIWVKTSDCQDCGMVGAVGKLSAKVKSLLLNKLSIHNVLYTNCTTLIQYV